MDSFTRRDLVQRGAILAGAAGVASVVGMTGIEKALAAGTQLSAQRQATYSALVEAVALSPTAGVSASNLDRSTARFAKYYAEGGEGMRTAVGIVLDTVESGPGGAGFAELPKRARLAQLKDWLEGDLEAESARGHRWRAIAPQAVELAALPFRQHVAEPQIMVAL